MRQQRRGKLDGRWEMEWNEKMLIDYKLICYEWSTGLVVGYV